MKRRLHNTILRSITALAAAAFVIGAMLLDSESLIPAAMVMGGIVWLTLFYYAQER
ncbi:hypothetical protein [Shuttleworthella satelles]|uniref:Uncharacterized protein n=1 Tax=Shuttleworthella satelles DSM 14600 TaxID=626523 RepID=C4GAU1_9FIRM|nr:hypothetical protein [Shuttleworthia satelles]EEP28234.1 hypothetical protein GCWU000342_01042 [Shuttleworthia satelles DSM 14600]